MGKIQVGKCCIYQCEGELHTHTFCTKHYQEIHEATKPAEPMTIAQWGAWKHGVFQAVRASYPEGYLD